MCGTKRHSESCCVRNIYINFPAPAMNYEKGKKQRLEITNKREYLNLK